MALAKFNHGMISTGVLSNNLQVILWLCYKVVIWYCFVIHQTCSCTVVIYICSVQDALLLHLGVSPQAVDHWPTTLLPRTLAVLAEILLLKQQKEREAKQLKSQSEAAVINIWNRFITTLKSLMIYNDGTENYEGHNLDTLYALISSISTLVFVLHHFTHLFTK